MTVQDYFALATLMPTLALALLVGLGCSLYFARAALIRSAGAARWVTDRARRHAGSVSRMFAAPPMPEPAVVRASHALIGRLER